MGVRGYLKDPSGRRSISQAIRGAFERKRGVAASSGRILVVDDDPLTRETLVRALQRANYEVVGARGGDEAVGNFERYPFDVVVADTTPPEHRGSDTLAALRQLSPELKVVTVTSRVSLDREVRSRGATNTLVKPFDYQELLHAIKRVLQD